MQLIGKGKGSMDERKVDSTRLREQCIGKLTLVGVPIEQARIVADVLVHANLRGVDSHGIMRLEHYIRKIKQGGINPVPNIQIRATGPVTAIVDGDDGLGHIIAETSMQAAIDLASSNGLGMVSATNSSHCGALSYFVRMAAEAGMIGIAMANTDKMVVPHRGKSAFFGTNPLAFSFPAGENPPIILDMATSAAAYGKVLEALDQGRSIPPDWGVDEAGEPVTDPRQFSALLPFGGAKGYGLGMVVDIFAGILTGSPFGPYISPMYGDDYGKKRKLGHFFCAIEVSRFTNESTFIAGISQMIDDLHSMKPAPGFEQIMIPGEPEQRTEERRERDGIPISAALWKYLNDEEDLKD